MYIYIYVDRYRYAYAYYTYVHETTNQQLLPVFASTVRARFSKLKLLSLPRLLERSICTWH